MKHRKSLSQNHERTQWKNKEASPSWEASFDGEVFNVFPKLNTGTDETNLHDGKQHVMERLEIRRGKDKTSKKETPTHWCY